MSVEQEITMLRLHDGTLTGTGWHHTGEITENDIKKIPDGSGENSRFEISSIPSPFSRLEIFKDAFKNVSSRAARDYKEMDGNTIHHKLVSHSLDVGQIFFDFDKYKKNFPISITVWNLQSELNTMRASGNEKQRLLSETLDLYRDQKVRDCYILNYNDQPIGGTSLSTLFFCGPDDLGFIDNKLKSGNDTFFDDDYYPLHRRNFDYQKYLHLLFKVYPELQKECKPFWDYLAASLQALQKTSIDRYKRLQKFLNDNSYDSYRFETDFHTFETGQGGAIAEILPNIPHRKRIFTGGDNLESDFKMGSYSGGVNKKVKTALPLVLHNDFGERLNYIGDEVNWESSINVPYHYNIEPNKRMLPDQAQTYPFLVISDFLEPTLIRTLYPADDKNFFSGNLKLEDEGAPRSYLLPIKPLFFDYFEPEDLQGRIDNEKVIEINEISSSTIEVTLRIPIVADGKYITFRRKYEFNRAPNLDANRGSVKEVPFITGILPHVEEEKLNHRYVALATEFNVESEEVSLNFFNKNTSEPVGSNLRYRSRQRTTGEATTAYYEVSEHFDYFQVENAAAVGVIMPIEGKRSGGVSFSFAVDFGTTNTHVEYKRGNEAIKPFDITEKDVQLIYHHKDDFKNPRKKVLFDILEREIFPRKIGSDEEYSFPQRTAIAQKKGVNYNDSQSFSDMNIPFYFGKRTFELAPDEIYTNLKWMNLSEGGSSENETRVRLFLETLMIMLRNKVLLDGGNPAATQIVWFLPSSMSPMQKSGFVRIWKETFAGVFTGAPSSNLKMITESAAPFYAYDSQLVMAETYPVVNIDIGGGTSDIVVFKGSDPEFLTSVKFAGNSVFGDGYSTTKGTLNGIVEFATPLVKNIVNSVGNDSLRKLLAEMQGHSSSDQISFFLSLQDSNDFTTENPRNVSIIPRLQDHPGYKVVFLIFYSALIYHVVKMMKKLNMDMPRNIAFSGNGSKILNLIGNDVKVLQVFTKIFIEQIYGEKYHASGLDLILVDNPKEMTAKGGLKMLEANKNDQDFARLILLGDSENTIIKPDSMADPQGKFDSKLMKYGEVDDVYKNSVEQEVKEFYELFFGMNDHFTFSSMGISPSALDTYHTEIKRDMGAFIRKGFNLRLRLTEPQESVAESLFFYPIIGGLYNLTRFIK